MNTSSLSIARRVGLSALGAVMIGALFAWLVLRHQEPLSTWTTSSTLLGWAMQGAAWLSCLGGAWLIAYVNVLNSKTPSPPRTE